MARLVEAGKVELAKRSEPHKACSLTCSNLSFASFSIGELGSDAASLISEKLLLRPSWLFALLL